MKMSKPRPLSLLNTNIQLNKERRGSTPRRRTCSSPGLGLECMRSKKTKRQRFTKSLESLSLPSLKLQISKSCDFGGEGPFSTMSPRAAFDQNPPQPGVGTPSAHISKLMARFKIDSPTPGSPRMNSSGTKHVGSLKPRKLSKLSQLPSEDMEEDQQSEDECAPNATCSPVHNEAKEQATPVDMLKPFGMSTKTPENTIFPSFVTPDAAEPTMPDWATLGSENSAEKITDGKNPALTLKDHFSVAKSPFRSPFSPFRIKQRSKNKNSNSSFFSPCVQSTTPSSAVHAATERAAGHIGPAVSAVDLQKLEEVLLRRVHRWPQKTHTVHCQV